jgi:hypothetical protein
MAGKTGIRGWTQQRLISGARVAFDPRRTEQVDSTRDGNNYKAEEQHERKFRWELKQAQERAKRRQSAA